MKIFHNIAKNVKN